MSDLITHWAIHDDCRRLVLADSRFDPTFAEILRTHNEIARLGAITRYGGKWVRQILTSHRPDAGQTLDTPGRPGQRVAFALGGISHFAADLIMKPLMARLAEADWTASHQMAQSEKTEGKVSIREISAYYDVHTFGEVYLNGSEEPFNRFMFAQTSTRPAQALEQLVRSLFQRSLLSCHTFKPDPPDAQNWLDTLIDHIQPLYIQLDLYAKVFARPDPAKAKAFEVDSTFYRREDPVISAARAIQNGQAVPEETIDAAIAVDANPSAYGTAVALGVRSLREAAAYWQHRRNSAPDVSQG